MTLASRLATVTLGMTLLALTESIPISAMADDAATTGAVTVTVTYTGQGEVDDTHRIWIWLFDSPDIGPGSMPVREASVSKNGGSITIEGLGEDKVWIAVGYDQRGGSTGNAPPASGSPVGIHTGTDGRPVPVTTGDTAAAVVTFDDSVRMP
jgi:hypothetical protein